MARPFVVFAPVIWLGDRPRDLGVRDDPAGPRIGRTTTGGAGFSWRPFSSSEVSLGPDSLGEAHGDYLPQRIVLLGLVALVPIFDIDLSRWAGAA